MVAIRRPQHRLSKHLRIYVENGCLILLIEAVVVRVVAEHQPQVGVASTCESRVRVAHRLRVRVAGAGISNEPHTHRALRPDNRRRSEVEGCIAGHHGRRSSYRVVIDRVRNEPGQRDLVLCSSRRLLFGARHHTG